MGDKFSYLRAPKRSCNRCDYEWFLRAIIKRNNIGKKILGVEIIEPKNCPDPRCKSPYWNKIRKLKVKA